MATSRSSRPKLLGLVTVAVTFALVATSCGRSGSSNPSGGGSSSASAKPVGEQHGAGGGPVRNAEEGVRARPGDRRVRTGDRRQDDPHRRDGRPRCRCGTRPGAGVLRRGRRVRQVVQRRRRDQRPYRSSSTSSTPSSSTAAQEVIQACQQRLHARRRRQRPGRHRREAAPGLQARPDPGLHRLPGGDERRAAGDAGGQRPDHLHGRRRCGCWPMRTRTPSRRSGIAGSSLASLTPQGLRAQEAYQKLGYKVTTRAAAAGAGRQLPAVDGAAEGSPARRRTSRSPRRTRARSSRA